MSDPNIFAAQNALAQLGYNPGPLDGLNGPKTRAAVMAFQRDFHITVDGIVGPQTRAALSNALAHRGGGVSPITDVPPAVIPGVPGTPIPTSNPSDLGPSPGKVAAGVAGVGVLGWLAFRFFKRGKRGRR